MDGNHHWFLGEQLGDRALPGVWRGLRVEGEENVVGYCTFFSWCGRGVSCFGAGVGRLVLAVSAFLVDKRNLQSGVSSVLKQSNAVLFP